MAGDLCIDLRQRTRAALDMVDLRESIAAAGNTDNWAVEEMVAKIAPVLLNAGLLSELKELLVLCEEGCLDSEADGAVGPLKTLTKRTVELTSNWRSKVFSFEHPKRVIESLKMSVEKGDPHARFHLAGARG